MRSRSARSSERRGPPSARRARVLDVLAGIGGPGGPVIPFGLDLDVFPPPPDKTDVPGPRGDPLRSHTATAFLQERTSVPVMAFRASLEAVPVRCRGKFGRLLAEPRGLHASGRRRSSGVSVVPDRPPLTGRMRRPRRAPPDCGPSLATPADRIAESRDSRSTGTAASDRLRCRPYWPIRPPNLGLSAVTGLRRHRRSGPGARMARCYPHSGNPGIRAPGARGTSKGARVTTPAGSSRTARGGAGPARRQSAA